MDIREGIEAGEVYEVSKTNFAGYPQSIAELRAEKADDGSLWTPRDALIDLLRKIDGGEMSPSDLAVVYQDRQAGTSGWLNASDNLITAVGLLATTVARLSIAARNPDAS